MLRTSLFATLALLFAASPVMAANAQLRVQGTTNLTPLLTKAASAYETAHLGTDIDVKGTSSGAGIAAIKDGSIDVAASDVAISDNALTDTNLGTVGFAFVANKSAGISNLTRPQAIGIFSGKIKNWKAVGGADEPITIISRGIGTGTRLVLEQKVAKTLIDTKVVDNANEVIKAVDSTPGAIGYVATYFVGARTDLVVSYNGIAPTPETIRNHTYAFSTDEHLYVRTDGNPDAKAFAQFVAANADLLNWFAIYR